ncbi:protoglobin domain-containing protein [uncultured Brevundimonas sp.]|uniref:hybrid sensor histidine kinase/response regulator n=1 Tax=uncultured Brevundimonas sp. TaxID=213418 RepID=UPI00260DD663|nr:protoglobin domain-containing protein [uncultured Brevundimonas sp.]
MTERMAFIRLEAADCERLRALKPIVEGRLPAALDDLYGQIQACDATRAFFREPRLLAKARQGQSAHWGVLAAADFGDDYVAGVRATGEAHARIGLEPRWYVGGYALVAADLVRAVVAEKWPAGAPPDASGADDMGLDLAALLKAVLLDIDLALSVYIDAARAAERTSAGRLKLALDAAHAGVFEVNFRDRSFWCSPEFVDIVGRSVPFEEAIGDVWQTTHPDDIPRVRRQIREWLDQDRFDPFEFRVVLPDGASRWIQINGEVHLDDKGQAEKLVGLVLDIDERKRQEIALVEAERAAQAGAEAKAQFLANMSHEIRTPMNGVLGVLHLLAKEPLSEDGRKLLAEASACGQMLSQLLNDVVDFSRIDAGRLELSPEPLDPADVLQSVAGLLRPQAEAKGVTLQARIEGGGGSILADPVRLRQVLFNLVGNAVKFTTEGHVEARLFIGDEDGGERRLRFEIEDTGIGIPEAVRESLFERFQQADGSTVRRFGGSGLGLAITRDLVEMMGGELDFTSRDGRGSIFWFEVSAPVAAATAPEAVGDSAGCLAGLSILVVEDNPTNRLVATRILEGLGAAVETADDGLLGLEAVQSRPFDLVLMDVQMPRMDGIEATRRIRALAGPAGRTPIIGLTANALSDQRRDYLAAGMDGVASKPISPAALLAEIGRVMDGAEGSTAGPAERAG